MGKGAVAGVVVVAAVIAQVSQVGDLAPLVVGGVLITANGGLLLWSARRARPPDGSVLRFTGVLAACWLALSILPLHNFASRSSAAATSSVTLQPLLEIVVFGAVALVAAGIVRTLEPTLALARPPMALALLPLWIMVSSLWSDSGPYAMVRGAQMLGVVLLAWATLAVGRVDRSALGSVVEKYLRWFVRITVVLVGLGLAFGTIYVAVARSNMDRFAWVGAHPNGAGLVLSAAIIIAFSTPATVLRLPRYGPVIVGGGLLVALYDNHSRTAWLCVAVGLLVTFTLQGHLQRLSRWVWTPLLGAGVVAAIAFHGPAIWDYLLRDRDTESLATGNGRRELWTIGARALDGPGDWLGGLGYGATRWVFLEDAPWAGEAHNSVLAILVSVGLIGVALLCVAVGVTAVELVRARIWTDPAIGVPIVSLFVLMLVNGMASDLVAEPNIGFAVVNLAAVTAMAHRAWRAGEPTTYARPAGAGASASVGESRS